MLLVLAAIELDEMEADSKLDVDELCENVLEERSARTVCEVRELELVLSELLWDWAGTLKVNWKDVDEASKGTVLLLADGVETKLLNELEALDKAKELIELPSFVNDVELIRLEVE